MVRKHYIYENKNNEVYDDLYSYADEYRFTTKWTKTNVETKLDRIKRMFNLSDIELNKIISKVNKDYKRKNKVKSDPYSDSSYKAESYSRTRLRENNSDSEYTYIKSKEVLDFDGFNTEYTMYYDEVMDRYVFVLGDSDMYDPNDGYVNFDYECDTEREANEWFSSYEGFDDDYFESCTISEDIDISNYIYVTNKNGYDIYKLNGSWAAVDSEGNAFDITYEQARGFEPINPIDYKLQHGLKKSMRMESKRKKRMNYFKEASIKHGKYKEGDILAAMDALGFKMRSGSYVNGPFVFSSGIGTEQFNSWNDIIKYLENVINNGVGRGYTSDEQEYLPELVDSILNGDYPNWFKDKEEWEKEQDEYYR